MNAHIPAIRREDMRLAVLVAMCTAILGCVAERHPDSGTTVAAFEVALHSERDRREFLSVLKAAAEAEGMHVNFVEAEELEREAKVNRAFSKTVNAAVWSGSHDDETVASAMDQFDHLGRIWLLFSRGTVPVTATQFRKRAMHEIMLHWPDTLALPIMPTGTIPLSADLMRTPTGYIVKPSEAHKYQAATAQQPH